jgi:hypothetical protein
LNKVFSKLKSGILAQKTFQRSPENELIGGQSFGKNFVAQKVHIFENSQLDNFIFRFIWNNFLLSSKNFANPLKWKILKIG